MEYVNLGKAGLKVSRIALGLGLREQSSADEAERLIEHAIDSGINFIDCANRYGLGDDRDIKRGTSEQVLARVLRTRRDDVVITTKVTGAVAPGPNDLGASRYHLMREVERSLSRLGTDHIDIYLLHSYFADTPIEETLRGLDDLVTQGKVRYVGCCNFAAWQVVKALWTAYRIGADPFICVQNPYNLLDRGLEREMFGLVRDQGLGVMAYSPLAAGLLTGDYTPGEAPPEGSLWARRSKEEYESLLPAEAGAVLKTIRDVADGRGRSMPQVGLNWVLSKSEVTVAISGIDTIERLDENLGAVGWQLSDLEVASLDEASAPFTWSPGRA